VSEDDADVPDEEIFAECYKQNLCGELVAENPICEEQTDANGKAEFLFRYTCVECAAGEEGDEHGRRQRQSSRGRVSRNFPLLLRCSADGRPEGNYYPYEYGNEPPKERFVCEAIGSDGTDDATWQQAGGSRRGDETEEISFACGLEALCENDQLMVRNDQQILYCHEVGTCAIDLENDQDSQSGGAPSVGVANPADYNAIALCGVEGSMSVHLGSIYRVGGEKRQCEIITRDNPQRFADAAAIPSDGHSSGYQAYACGLPYNEGHMILFEIPNQAYGDMFCQKIDPQFSSDESPASIVWCADSERPLGANHPSDSVNLQDPNRRDSVTSYYGGRYFTSRCLPDPRSQNRNEDDDSCRPPDDCWVDEPYCTQDYRLAIAKHECANGCEDGACL
jgi:hypothetical protein